ncbi:MAG: hypothetical protein U0K28_06160, partial [Prevotellamassilia sp.]|nr:hypothetical protein [Prevotellamassilia sp.]
KERSKESAYVFLIFRTALNLTHATLPKSPLRLPFFEQLCTLETLKDRTFRTTFTQTRFVKHLPLRCLAIIFGKL